MRTLLVFYLCAALGGFIASIADIVQKEEASAVAKLTSVTARQLSLTMAPYSILIGLVIVAAALCFVFQPTNRRQSFTIGAGVIALIMTVTPYHQPPTGVPGPADSSGETGLLGIGPLHFVSARLVSESGRGILSFVVSNSTDTRSIISISVYIPSDKQEFLQKNIVDAGTSRTFEFDMKDVAPGQSVFYSVESEAERFPAREFVYAGLDDRVLIVIGSANARVTEQSSERTLDSYQLDNFGQSGSAIGNFSRKLLSPFKW